MAEYPGSPLTLEVQNTSNDGAPDPTKAQAANFNKLDQNVQAIGTDLAAAFASESVATIALAFAKFRTDIDAAGGGALFVAKIGGAAETHADINAAIAAYNAGSEKRAVFNIGEVSADWGGAITISKTIKFVGVIEGAGIAGLTPPSVNFVDTAQPEIEFENITLTTSSGDGAFSMFDSTILTFTNCSVSNIGDTGATTFAMLASAGGIGLLTIHAKDSFFDCLAGGAGTAILFSNGKVNGDIEFHLEHCSFFNLAGGASAGILALTDNGGSISVFLKDGTVLHRPGFNTSGAGAENLDITYDGSSLVTNYITGGTESQANVIGGTVTINGEAAYNTIMDSLDADLDIQRALVEFLGDHLRLAAGTYVTATAIDITRSNVVITGAGCENTFINSSAATINFKVSGNVNRIFGITVTPNTSVPTAIFELSGDKNKLVECRAITANSGVYTSIFMIKATGNRNWVVDCMVVPDTVTIGIGVGLTGDFNFVRGTTFRPSAGAGDVSVIAFSTATASTGNRVYENFVDLVGYNIGAGLRVGGTASQFYNNYLYSGGAATYDFGIDTHGTPTECRIDNNHIENDAGVPTAAIELKSVTDSLVRGNAVYGAWGGASVGLRSDVNCDDNLYSHNHLLAIDTPGDRLKVDAGDNSASPDNVVS